MEKRLMIIRLCVRTRSRVSRSWLLVFRDAELIEHSVLDLVRQRVYGIALGYEDLNDHDDLKWDPLLALALGKGNVEGKARRRNKNGGGKGEVRPNDENPPQRASQNKNPTEYPIKNNPTRPVVSDAG